MKILGISGSPRDDKRSGVHCLVKTVLKHTGCAHDNICRVNDDLTPLRHYYLGDPEAVSKAMQAVSNQGKAKA